MTNCAASSVQAELLFPSFTNMKQEAQYADLFTLRFSLQYLNADKYIRSVLREVLYEHIVRFCDRAMLVLVPAPACCPLIRKQHNDKSELESIRTICQKYLLILQALDADSKESPEFATKKQILDFVAQACQEVLLYDSTQEKQAYL